MKSITQDMRYKQSLMEYSLKYGVQGKCKEGVADSPREYTCDPEQSFQTQQAWYHKYSPSTINRTYKAFSVLMLKLAV